MANVIITFKVMPISPEEDLEQIKVKTSELIKGFGGEVYKSEEHPIAFGLKAVHIMFIMDEAKGSTDDLEAQVTEIKAVQSCEVIDVRRAVG